MAFNDGSDKIFSYVLKNNTLTITAEDGIRSLAMKLVSGVGQFAGTMRLKTLVSTPIPLVIGEPVVITDEKAISKLVIDCSAGVIQIIAAKN